MRLTAGKPIDQQELAIWVEASDDGKSIYLVAKHSQDAASQNLAIIRADADGKYNLETRKLFSRNLRDAVALNDNRLGCYKSRDED